MFVVIVSSIEFVVKMATVAILYANEPECKSALSNLPANVKSIFSGPSAYQHI